jgi:hypothetical protein
MGDRATLRVVALRVGDLVTNACVLVCVQALANPFSRRPMSSASEFVEHGLSCSCKQVTSQNHEIRRGWWYGLLIHETFTFWA